MPLTVYDLAVPARQVHAAEVMVGERVILTGKAPEPSSGWSRGEPCTSPAGP
jgi:hypothetical protein